MSKVEVCHVEYSLGPVKSSAFSRKLNCHSRNEVPFILKKSFKTYHHWLWSLIFVSDNHNYTYQCSDHYHCSQTTSKHSISVAEVSSQTEPDLTYCLKMIMSQVAFKSSWFEHVIAENGLVFAINSRQLNTWSILSTRFINCVLLKFRCVKETSWNEYWHFEKRNLRKQWQKTRVACWNQVC